MSRHASLEDLASYTEGALKPRKAAKIASHLAECPECSEKLQDLQAVPSLLASVQFPPMPAHLSSRISLAIAAESAARVTSEQAPGEASRRDLPVRGREPRRRGWRVPGFSSPLVGSLAAVGAAVIIAGGGYEVASNLSGGQPATSSPSSAHQAPAAVNSGAAAGAAPVRYGPVVPLKQHDATINHIQTVETSTNFMPGADFASQTQKVYGEVRTSNLKYSGQSLTSPYAHAGPIKHVNADQIRGCVARITAGKNVLLVDIAEYQGKPATIIVVGTQPRQPAVGYAVGEACSAAKSDILTKQNLPYLER